MASFNSMIFFPIKKLNIGTDGDGTPIRPWTEVSLKVAENPPASTNHEPHGTSPVVQTLTLFQNLKLPSFFNPSF